MTSPFEPVVGLEVHAQLLTRTKIFCACSTAFGARPNSNVCPVCLGLPGSLPVLNAEAVRMAVRIGLALGCSVQEKSTFARKNYFYPDLPKGYQISQYDEPLCKGGHLEIAAGEGTRRVGIERVHMEEDAGKNLHGVAGDSVVDLNRAGTPLVEIVGAPDLRSSAEAADYLRRLREILMALGVNDGNLEEGSFRCDANVSVRQRGDTKLGTRCEIKNVNSFRFVERAIDYEVGRQVALVAAGQRIAQQTLRWDEASGRTYPLRSKEEANDYRYFPEPDLPPLVIDAEFASAQKASLEELPAARRARLVEKHRLSPAAAAVLTAHPRVADFFERAAGLHGDAVKVANFLQTEVMRDVKTTGLAATFPISAEQLAEMLALVDEKAISGKQAKEVYAKIAGTETSPRRAVAEAGLAQMSDAGELETICRRLLDANPKQVAGYRSGKTALLGFFVGQAMKETRGSANPALVNEILVRLLSAS
ncbi:MAG TPA: Asp-tRNA(Asn)/Glu-tRNA(Gln) amidotransferase subunit GatB [Polyangiaceae bacterium]|jgi:aspartyl-tRNA(Asn)/glutamyl-tRNA(Gln) amidotransferase subunit B|nr:Asp-tRNA(Asn)/Glu-tRNA(Gln) amidotransferase subunit GatB [Polyangiaceae bacterium]